MNETEALHRMVLASLDDDQALETVSIPLAGKSSIADYMVIASGRSSRQVASMATKLAERVKAEFASWMDTLKAKADPSAKPNKAWNDAAFKKADSDKSASVTKTELASFLSSGTKSG